jgi:hypothetical protein
VKVLYIQKQIEGDYSFPTAQQCVNPSVVTPFYPYSLTANHDVSTVRLATTTNGVNFTDLGPVNRLNDSTTVSYVGIRYVSPNGGLVPLPNGNWACSSAPATASKCGFRFVPCHRLRRIQRLGELDRLQRDQQPHRLAPDCHIHRSSHRHNDDHSC